MSEKTVQAAVPPNNVVLCISASFGRPRLINEIIPADIFPTRYLASDNPSEQLREAKESGKPIVLVVLGPSGHDAIKYLCDDYKLPAEERRVRWIHSVSAGVDWYRPGDIQEEIRGIPFTNGRGGYSYFLALHVMYSILYFNRDTPRLMANKRKREWDMFDMTEPRGQKVGIIGYGDIGRATARMLQPLLMDVTGVKRTLSEAEEAQERDEFGARLVCGTAARDAVIAESDYVVNILPSTPATKGLFNKAVFETMKKTAVYINIGRGSTQNEADLCDALNNNVIGGASLDVFEQEPLPPNAAVFDVSDDKMLMTSHNACITGNSFRETLGLFVTAAKEYLKSGTITGYHPDVTKGY